MSEPWFDPAIGGYFGLGIGILGGILGTTIGILGGVFVPRGQARGTVRGLLTLMVAFGLVFLAFGLVALAAGQPYAIWFPPTLGGAIFTFVAGINLLGFRAIDREIDRRKMDADDLRNS